MKTDKTWQVVCAAVLVVVSIVSLGMGNRPAAEQSERAVQLPAADQLPAAEDVPAADDLPVERPAPGVEPRPRHPAASPERRAVDPTVSEACARALETVHRAGLRLASGTEFRCPGNTETTPGDRQHSGVACFDHQWYCPQSSYIAVNPEQIRRGDQGMQYVIAHEICHIESYRATGTPGTEDGADACAAAAGFPR